MAHLDHVQQTMQTLSEHQYAIGAHETLNRYDVQSETNERLNKMDLEKEVEKYKSIPAITDKGMNSYIDELFNSESFIRDQIKEKVKRQVEDEKLEWEFPGMILKTFNYEKFLMNYSNIFEVRRINPKNNPLFAIIFGYTQDREEVKQILQLNTKDYIIFS